MPQLKKGKSWSGEGSASQSINNIPLDARNHGYTVLDIQQDGPTIRYLIQKYLHSRRDPQREHRYLCIT